MMLAEKIFKVPVERLEVHMNEKGGKHLSAARAWMQYNAVNGSDVTWASDEVLKLKSLTVKDIEELALTIANAVKKEIKYGLEETEE